MHTGLFHIDFGVDVNAKAVFDIALDGLVERHDLGTGSTATVDEHQSLACVYPDMTYGTSTPSALVYHPSRRYLDMVSIDAIMRHIRIECKKLLEMVLGNDGVHKETAGIALNFGVGQLGMAYIDDGLAQLVGCGHVYAPLSKRSPDVAIVETR